MRRVREAIVVEGRYDKNAVSQVVDAVIVETEGFHIFSDREKLSLLRRLQETRGLILLTDGDGAGFLIRNHLKGALGADVKQAYVPDIFAKERRKRHPSKEGKLGVEGMSPAILLQALERAGATFLDEDTAPQPDAAPLTRADFYALGLSGGADSGKKRVALLKKLELPARLSAKALVDVLNALYTREEIFALCKDLA